MHEGVESGSVVLRGADGRTWQLGRSHGHLVGCTVALRGRPRRDVMTTAQQGVPLEVLAVEVVAGTPGEHRPGSEPRRRSWARRRRVGCATFPGAGASAPLGWRA